MSKLFTTYLYNIRKLKKQPFSAFCFMYINLKTSQKMYFNCTLQTIYTNEIELLVN